MAVRVPGKGAPHPPLCSTLTPPEVPELEKVTNLHVFTGFSNCLLPQVQKLRGGELLWPKKKLVDEMKREL